MTEKGKILLADCLDGSKAAWDAFVLQYSGLVYHTIKKTLDVHHARLEADVIDDLHQEFFISIFQDNFAKLRQFRGDNGCSLASWLRMIAARLSVDFLRRQKPATSEIPDDLASEDPAPVESLLDREEKELLLEAIEDLSPRDRLLLDLDFRKGLPPEEISAILRVSVSAVYTQKSRLLAKLREILKKTESR